MSSASQHTQIGGFTLLGPKEATELDVDLMSSEGGFSLDQLMELAGLSVASAYATVYPLSSHPRVLIIAGPGNNGGDGLVAARHLRHFGYQPYVVYPKRPSSPLFTGLVVQCEALGIPVVVDLPAPVGPAPSWSASWDGIIDAIFGFSFKGAPRAPFDALLGAVQASGLPILSVDIPSGWDVELGDVGGRGIRPQVLVSLTAPKKCAAHFHNGRHFLGGRFVPPAIVAKYGLILPEYPGSAQAVELTALDSTTAAATACDTTGALAATYAPIEATAATAATAADVADVAARAESGGDGRLYETTDELAVVWVTAPAAEAKELAEVLVTSRLAACVNIFPTVESVYEWEGRVEASTEALLMVKTRKELLPSLTDLVKKRHSYDVPETIAMSIIGGSRLYLDWVKANTKEPPA